MNYEITPSAHTSISEILWGDTFKDPLNAKHYLRGSKVSLRKSGMLRISERSGSISERKFEVRQLRVMWSTSQ